MALPELVRLGIEKKLSKYSQKKCPTHVSDLFKAGFRHRGNGVTLYEERLLLSDPGKWVEVAVAQFRFDTDTALWTLYWRDRNSRWHCYDDLEPSKSFDRLLKEVDDDPTGIFWG